MSGTRLVVGPSLVVAWAALGVGTAHAAALDTIEVGGPWGTPGATDGTAIWWNPGGLAAGQGTRFQLEAAPSWGAVLVRRADPNGGYDEVGGSGIVPFAGVATDAGVPGLGLGLGLVVPIARDGEAGQQPGPLSFRIREGGVKAIYAMVGGGYEIADRVSLGVSASYILAEYKGEANTSTLASLNEAIVAEGGDPYTDALLEDPDYSSTVFLGPLHGHGLGFGAGTRVQIDDKLSFAVSYQHPVSIVNTGDALIDTGCPPESDEAGRFIIESRKLCDTTLDVHAKTTLKLPMRIYTSFVVEPGPWRLEPFFGWVGWHVIDTSTTSLTDAVELNPDVPEEASSKIDTDSVQAKNNRDAVFVGMDAKVVVAERWTFGGRVLGDQAAVPLETLAPDNFDSNTLQLGALAAFAPIEQLQLGVSYTHHLVQNREVTDSAYRQTLDPLDQPPTGYSFAHANGLYGANQGRLGVQLRGAF